MILVFCTVLVVRGDVTEFDYQRVEHVEVYESFDGGSPVSKVGVYTAYEMTSMREGHSLERDDVFGKESASWWATSSTGTLEHSRKFSQSVLEAGEPKLLSVKDPDIAANSFYQFVEEYQPDDANEDLLDWLKRDNLNGVVQVYTPGSTYCDLVKSTISTTAETVMAKCLAKELYVQYGGRVRKLDVEDHPLHIQNEFLRSIGYEDHRRIQLEGISPELGCLFKFVAG